MSDNNMADLNSCYVDSSTIKSFHWILQDKNVDNEEFIARLKINGYQYMVYINPTDARGYRTIVRFVHSDMRSTLNRKYTPDEKISLYIAVAFVQEIYEKFGTFSQVEMAGNNSHSFINGKFVIGDKEPSMLHAHIYGRGDPNFAYILGLLLRGPYPGFLFNMRGDTKLISIPDDASQELKDFINTYNNNNTNVFGNDSKASWNGLVPDFSLLFAITLNEVILNYTGPFVIEIVEIKH